MQVGSHLLVQMTAIAIAVGILAQVIAERARLPAIVILLAFGVVVGPDVLGLVDPQAFGAGLRAIVTIAVAVILFEGGLQLHYIDVAAVGRTVRNLVTVGALVTVAGATLAARWLVGFPWPMALLFGTIVCVTGPTVINPLLDRVRVPSRIDTILRGEGILIDPVGAVLAVVVLELFATAEASVWEGLLEFAFRMGIGTGIGLAGGWLLGRVLRIRRVFAPELKNLVVLAWVLALFAASEALASESGLAAVVLAGMAVRREAIPQQHQLRRFKGELSVLFISLLFILLTAFLPLETLVAVGWSGVWTVVVLMVVVRPLDILVSTWGSGLGWRDRVFLSWISPRGVVAISIASFVAILLRDGAPELAARGLTPEDGEALLALVFLTIAITVVVQGLTAGPAARLLGLRAEAGGRILVIGADRFGQTLASLLERSGWEPFLLDTNAGHVAEARGAGLAAMVGNAVDRNVLEQAGAADAEAMVATTGNQEINVIVARIVREELHVPAVFPVLVAFEEGASEELVEELGGEVAFGRRLDVDRWNGDLRRGRAVVRSAIAGPAAAAAPLGQLELPEAVVPLLARGEDRARICHVATRLEPGERVLLLVRERDEPELERWFRTAAEPKAVR